MATPVTIEDPELLPRALLPYIIALLFAVLTKITVVWIAIAILAPQFGITWLMVLVALWALAYIRPVDYKRIIRSVNRLSAGQKPTLIVAKADAELLRKRAAL